MFSRPDRDEFSKRKRWEISCQTQKKSKIEPQGRKPEYGLHVATIKKRVLTPTNFLVTVAVNRQI
jgi:hypothetical protein